MHILSRSSIVLVLLSAGCGEDSATPAFPTDYRTTYTEVRDCRASADHDLHAIRIWASPDAVTPYMGRTAPFPEGAILLKEEFEFGDDTCSTTPVRFTVMEKLPSGSMPETLDWTWLDLDAQRKIKTTDEPRCIGCHTSCGNAPDGYDGTCAVP